MELSSARSKLDGVLQTLVEKKDDSISPEKEITLNPPESDEEISPVGTPTKKVTASTSKVIRKRKRGREDPTPESANYHHSFVMKLFDRSVDLAQFTEDTPLYPVCRAWIQNKPRAFVAGLSGSRASEASHSCTDIEKIEPGDITALTVPQPIKSEHGHYVDLRIPSPVPQPSEKLDIHADQNTARAPEDLLLNHMAHWKQVRQKWKNASRLNELHDSHNLKLLKDMYESHCQDQ